MKILLSAHKDKVYSSSRLEFSKGVHTGLLDNQIGMLATYLAVYTNASLFELSKQGEIGIFHSEHEEFALDIDFPKLSKETIVLVVDLASGKQYAGKHFSLENIFGFEKDEIKNLRESLEWEGYKFLTKPYDGTPEDEDESWVWIKKKQKVLSFIIPVQGESWHHISGNNSLTSDVMKMAVQGLIRTINYLL